MLNESNAWVVFFNLVPDLRGYHSFTVKYNVSCEIFADTFHYNVDVALSF